jgi:hypothetical protein
MTACKMRVQVIRIRIAGEAGYAVGGSVPRSAEGGMRCAEEVDAHKDVSMQTLVHAREVEMRSRAGRFGMTIVCHDDRGRRARVHQ